MMMVHKRKSKIRWGTLLVAITGIAAVLGEPAIAGLVPEKYSHMIATISVVILALKKHVVREEHERSNY